MTAYILGAGASVSSGYPLAPKLLEKLSACLDGCDQSVHWVLGRATAQPHNIVQAHRGFEAQAEIAASTEFPGE
jgi:hypothetical protein